MSAGGVCFKLFNGMLGIGRGFKTTRSAKKSLLNEQALPMGSFISEGRGASISSRSRSQPGAI